MADQNGFHPHYYQQLQMQQSRSTSPLYDDYSHDGRDQLHTTSYQQFPPQYQMQQMNSSAQSNGILRNSYQQVGNSNGYSQQNSDIARSLMAQLQQKEAELTKYKVICDEFQKARSRLDAQALLMAEKDKRIAMLVGKLNLERRSNGSTVADAISDSKIKRLNEQLEENKREIKSRDDEIAKLKTQNKICMSTSNLDQELPALKDKYVQLKEQNSTCTSTIEELVKRVKAKELMISLLKTENEEYRNRETRLNAQVSALKHTIESCDVANKNSGVDVPMLLAKLADYEAQAKQFQNQQQHHTSTDKMDEENVSLKEKKFDDGTTTVSSDSSTGVGDTIDDDDSTFDTMKSLMEEVTDGIHSWWC